MGSGDSGGEWVGTASTSRCSKVRGDGDDFGVPAIGTLGITGLSKSQVSVMAQDLDAQVERSAPARWTPALHLRRRRRVDDEGRENNRVVKIAVMIATGVNAEDTAKSLACIRVRPSPVPDGSASSGTWSPAA